MKLGRFTISFAETVDEMSLEAGFRIGGTRFHTINYTLFRESQEVFPTFSDYFLSRGREQDALRPRVAGGGFAASVSLTLGIFCLPRGARVETKKKDCYKTVMFCNSPCRSRGVRLVPSRSTAL